MAVSAKVTRRNKSFKVSGYTVNEDATPLTIEDTSGSVGTISVAVVNEATGAFGERVSGMIGEDLQLVDDTGIEFTPFKGRGYVNGRIVDTNDSGPVTSIRADSVLSRLNAERDALAFYGLENTEPLITYDTNLATNPSSEVNTTNYSGVPGTGGAATLARTTTAGEFLYGTAATRLTWTTAATGMGGIQYNQQGIAASGVYSMSGYVRSSKAQSLRMLVTWLTSGGATISTIESATVEAVAGQWVRLSVSGSAPATATQANILFRNSTSGESFSNWAVGNTLCVDGVMVSLGSSLLEYFDGSFANCSWQGTAHASASTRTVETPRTEGVNATAGNAFRYYCGLVGILPSFVEVDAVFDQMIVSFPAWSGNVWNHLKMMAPAVGGEIVAEGERVCLRAPRRRTILAENSNSFMRKVNIAGSAQNIDVVNQDVTWGNDLVALISNTTYNVDDGQAVSYYEEIEHDLESVNNPTLVRDPTELYTGGAGQYTVVDAENRAINPLWWAQRGGVVTTALVKTGNKRQIRIDIKGAYTDGSYTAPYKIARAPKFTEEEPQPSLYITGSGLFRAPKTMRLATGASEAQTTRDSVSVIDNPFITNRDAAMGRGALAALSAAGPMVEIRGRLSHDYSAQGQEFGRVIGSRIKYDNSYYRITSASMTALGVDFAAEADTTFGDLTAAHSMTFGEADLMWAGLTFGGFDTLYAGYTFGQLDEETPQTTFEQFDAIYAGATFADFSVWPLAT